MKGKQIKLSGAAAQKIQEFETNFDPQKPEAGEPRPCIIGYGEMSTVFTFDHPELQGLAFKRMAVFRTAAEIERYEGDFYEYHRVLNDMGVFTPDYGTHVVTRTPRGAAPYPILYVCQGLLNPAGVGSRYVRERSEAESVQLFTEILRRFEIVFRYNKQNIGVLELGLDGQISNWAAAGDPGAGKPPALLYLDTSTPLMRRGGVEQLDPELFLRVCPSYLVWMIRLFFLKDVLNRYYDLRLVIIDLLGNLIKEKKADLIDPFLLHANRFLAEKWPDLLPIQRKEVESYYKEDAMIWRIFLAFRKFERFMNTRLQGREYPLVLPEKVER
ncbi:MAG: hypothetical protein HY042_07805 [Spirochaetia bacterium]|nr:hypothetical protein [Spirochaetia bacterium]